jgi:hypothetical protein
MVSLTLYCANGHRRSGDWQAEDYDVVDPNGDRTVGRIYKLDEFPGRERWLWGLDVEAHLDGVKRYGHAALRADAMAAFKNAYVRWA